MIASFRIAHRGVFPHSTFGTSSKELRDSDAILEAFREYTETALRAELDQYEWSGRVVRVNFEDGNRNWNDSQRPDPDTRMQDKGLVNTESAGAKKLKAALPDAAGMARNEGRSRREPAPSEQQ
jgi:hypothetical protein